MKGTMKEILLEAMLKDIMFMENQSEYEIWI